MAFENPPLDSDYSVLQQNVVVRAVQQGNGAPSDPVVAVRANGDFAVAWSDEAAGGDLAPKLRFFSANGQPKSAEIEVNQFGEGRITDIAYAPDDTVLVIYNTTTFGDRSAVAIKRFTESGSEVGNTITLTGGFVNTAARDGSIAVFDNGNFVVAFTQIVLSRNMEIEVDLNVYAQSFASNGTAMATAFEVSGISLDEFDPDVAVLASKTVDDDKLAIAVSYTSAEGNSAGTNDVFIRTFDLGGQRVGTQLINTDEEGDEGNTSVAIDADGRVYTSFGSVAEGGSSGAHFRRFNSDLTAADVDQVLVSATDGQMPDTDVSVSDDGRFAIGYEETGASEPSVTVFAADSTEGRLLPLGADVLGQAPNVAMTPDGSRLVVVSDGAQVSQPAPVFSAFSGTPFDPSIIQNIQTGTNGEDVLIGSGGNDTITALGGNDVIRSGSGEDVIYAGAGDDTIEPGPDQDLIYGGADLDTIDYSASVTRVVVFMGGSFGAGRPQVGSGDSVRDRLFEIENIRATNMSDFLSGSELANTLTGLGGNDTIAGAEGNDVVDGGAGADALYGGEDDDRILGGGGSDRLFGEDGNDALDGGGGSDTLVGGAGADQLNGGNGIDTADYSRSSAKIEIRLSGSPGSGGDAEGDRLTGIENLIGSEFDDTLIGDGAGNTIDGLGGADSIIGSADVDVLAGGTSGDQIRGNAGNDEIYGDEGNDRLFGDEDEDMLFGGANDDRIFGGGDNDTIEGGTGDDSLFGTLGADIIYGGEDDDLIAGNAGADVLYGDAGNDVIYGNEFADDLYGGAQDDTLNGGSGLDELFGGGGSDLLNGGASSDQLSGGGGADTFQFTVTGGIDRITDWQDGIDVLDFTAAGLGFGDFTVSTFGGGAGAKIVGGGYVVFLEGVATSDIDGSDFL